MESRFRKFNCEKIPNLVIYVQDYLERFPESEVLIGTDSQNNKRFTLYATVVALYRPGKGAHCVYHKWKVRRMTVRSVRLLSEVWASIEVANLLRDNNINIKYIDIDVNPNPRYKSYEVFESARGMVEGLGYEVRYKTFTPLITSMADWVVKS